MSRGPAYLLKIGDGDPVAFRTVAGLRQTALSIERGVMSITGLGIFLGQMAEQEVRDLALSGQPFEAQLSFEDGSKTRGKFLVTKLDLAGEYGGERNYSISIESVGEFGGGA